MPASPVILFKHARSGSTLLATLLPLITHRNFVAEVDKPHTVQRLALLQNVSDFSINPLSSSGTVDDVTKWKRLGELTAQAGSRAVVLERCNAVKHAISFIRASSTKEACGGVKAADCKNTRRQPVPVAVLRRVLPCVFQQRAGVLKAARATRLPLRTVAYETLQSDEPAVARQLRRFLGAPAHATNASSGQTYGRKAGAGGHVLARPTKSGSDDLRELVSNFGELEAELRSTPCLLQQLRDAAGGKCILCPNPWEGTRRSDCTRLLDAGAGLAGSEGGGGGGGGKSGVKSDGKRRNATRSASRVVDLDALPMASRPAPARRGGPIIFYLGLQKAGTTSLHLLARQLGLRSLHASVHVYDELRFLRSRCEANLTAAAFPDLPRVLRELGGADRVKAFVEAMPYEVFTDMPWPLLYRTLEAIPNSRFVFWKRNTTQWLSSMARFFGTTVERRMQQLVYGECVITPANMHRFAAAYEAHAAAVLDFFRGPGAPAERRGRLLVADFSAPDAGRRICDFMREGWEAAAGVGRCGGLAAMISTRKHGGAIQHAEFGVRLPRIAYWVITPEHRASRSAAALRGSWLSGVDARYCVVGSAMPRAGGARDEGLVRLALPPWLSHLTGGNRSEWESAVSVSGKSSRAQRHGGSRAAFKLRNRFLQAKVMLMVEAMCADALDDASTAGYHLMVDDDTLVNHTNLQRLLAGAGRPKELRAPHPDVPLFGGKCYGTHNGHEHQVGGGPGILLSRGALRSVCPRLRDGSGAIGRERCERFFSDERPWTGGDRWVFRCLSAHGLNVTHCSSDQGARGRAGRYLFRQSPPWVPEGIELMQPGTWGPAEPLARALSSSVRRQPGGSRWAPTHEVVSFHSVLAREASADALPDPRCAIWLTRKSSRCTGNCAEARCAPAFVIAGAPKAGTTSLFAYLAQHPDVLPPTQKELRFFTPTLAPSRHRMLNNLSTRSRRQLAGLYLSKFPHIGPRSFLVTGEASPAYLYSRSAALLFSKVLTSTKVVLLLREPIERLASEFAFRLARKPENAHLYLGTMPPRQRALAGANGSVPSRVQLACVMHARRLRCGTEDIYRRDHHGTGSVPARLSDSCRARVPPVVWQSIYHEFLPQWLGLGERLRVTYTDTLLRMPGLVMRSMGEFLGLPPHEYDTSLAFNTAAHPGLGFGRRNGSAETRGAQRGAERGLHAAIGEAVGAEPAAALRAHRFAPGSPAPAAHTLHGAHATASQRIGMGPGEYARWQLLFARSMRTLNEQLKEAGRPALPPSWLVMPQASAREAVGIGECSEPLSRG